MEWKREEEEEEGDIKQKAKGWDYRLYLVNKYNNNEPRKKQHSRYNKNKLT